MPSDTPPAVNAVDEPAGGDAACWAHLVCPECGALIAEGHRRCCPVGDDVSRAVSDGMEVPDARGPRQGGG